MYTNIDFPRKIYQGDSFTITLTIDSNLTNYKARCELFDDDDNTVRLATANSGGADTQIKITASTTSTIEIYVPKDETINFTENSYFEIEIEDTNGKITTLCAVAFPMSTRQINWLLP